MCIRDSVNITPLTIHFIFHQSPLLILSHRVVGPQAQSLLSLIPHV